MRYPKKLNRRRFLALGAMGAAALPGLAWARGFPDAVTVQAEVPPSDNGYRVAIAGLTRQGRLMQTSISIASVYQGGALRVRIEGALSATATLFGRDYPLAVDDSGAVGYVGIGVADPPGPATLFINAIDPRTGEERIERDLAILKTNWTVDEIWLPPSAPGGGGTPIDPAKIQEEINLLAATYAGHTGRQWTEPWIVPIPDVRISGYFGEQRSFNGGPVQGHHGGTDFAAPTGTPIRAANRGTVVVVRDVIIRGKMIIIDHGTGIYTGYAHLSSYAVDEGMTVEKGQVIGEVGSTGLSTGPHLHWEKSVFGVLVDGLRWLDGTQGF